AWASAPLYYRRKRLEHVGTCGSDLGFSARDVTLHDGTVRNPLQPTGRLAARQRNELIEHRPRDTRSHAGNAHRVKALHGEGIERSRLAPQVRILAHTAEPLRHKEFAYPIGVRTRTAQTDAVPSVEHSGLICRK